MLLRVVACVSVSGGSGPVSGSHSRSTGVRLGGGVQRTPSGKIRQRSKSRTKMGTRDRKETWLTQGRLHIDLWLRWINGVRISCSIPRVLNPSRLYYHPLNFQPPSPPRTIAQAAVEPTPIEMATPKGKIKEPTSTGRKNHTVSLASALSAFDMHTLSPGTLSPAFSSVFIGFYVGASPPPRTLQRTAPSTLTSSLVLTPAGSPFAPASPNKLAVGGVGHSLGKQSVSLGRATVVGVDGSPGLGRGKGVGESGSDGGGGANGTGSGSGSVPRQDSLGDLKIPARN